MITIAHSHAEGTLVHGTDRGDGTNHVIKATGGGWRFSRHIGVDGAWYLPRSRDRHPDAVKIEQLAAALREAGYQVEISVDDTPRATGEVEADRAERVTGRTERYTELAESRRSSGAARLEQVRQARGRIPLGQPVLDARDANYRERLHRREDSARAELAAGEHWRQRADAAQTTQRYRHNPRVTLRRIERLEADQRRWQRRLAEVRSGGSHGQYAPGGRYAEAAAASITRAEEAIARLSEQITYWYTQLEALKNTGQWAPWGPDHFRVGDQVKILGAWYPVLRVNRKSLTVSPLVLRGQQRPDGQPGKPPWTDTVRYDKVYGRCRDGHELHTPPPSPEATCTEPGTIPTFHAEFIPEPEAGPCTAPPVARQTTAHDGASCGCNGCCLLDPDTGARLAPWTEVRLWCADHAGQYQAATDGDLHRPPARTLEHLT